MWPSPKSRVLERTPSTATGSRDQQRRNEASALSTAAPQHRSTAAPVEKERSTASATQCRSISSINSTGASQHQQLRSTSSTASEIMKLTKRVVSLLPSGTEILCIIPGGAELLVGRSHEDNFPASITHLPMLTSQLISKTWTDAAAVDREVSTAMAEGRSLYSLDEALLSSLRPDLIITQDLCSVCSIDLSAVRSVAARLDYQPTVISLNPYSIEEVLNDIIAVGSAVGLQEPAQLAKDALEARVEAAAAIGAQLVAARGRVKVAFIEWSDPIYIGGHWTPQLITMAGGEHTLNPAGEGNPLFGHVQIGGTGKSFPVTPEALVASDPDVIVVAPCGLHLEEARREVEKLMAQDWFREIKAVRKRRLLVVDGDAMFNRPGPRLVDALEWLVSVLHKDGNGPAGCAEDGTASASVRRALQVRAAALEPAVFPYFDYFASKDEKGAAAAAGVEQQVTSTTSVVEKQPEERLTDIEDIITRIHRQACDRGDSTYKDPSTGYTVFTASLHRQRGKCCGNRCRHCPYGYFNVRADEQTKVPVISTMTLLRVQKRRQISDRLSSLSPPLISVFGAVTSADETDVDVIFWSGGKDSYLALLMAEAAATRSASGAKRRIVLLTTFDQLTGEIAQQGLKTWQIFAQAKTLGLDIMAVPLPPNCGGEDYVAAVKEGLGQLEAELRSDKILRYGAGASKDAGGKEGKDVVPRLRLVFGDLHLQDIRSWREAAFASYHMWFPLFGLDYSILQRALLREESDGVSVYTHREIESIKVSAWTHTVADTLTGGVGVGLGVGSEFNRAFLRDVGALGVDEMGERGEFHTHVIFV